MNDFGINTVVIVQAIRETVVCRLAYSLVYCEKCHLSLSQQLTNPMLRYPFVITEKIA